MDFPVEPERLGAVRLPDGRALGWAEWGPEDGQPVLLCPGAATSRRLGFAADALENLGVRLVSADRPGLGASSPAPARTLLDWPADVGALGLGTPGVVGFSQGAPFALACAAAGVASAVAVVSGTDELAHPSVDEDARKSMDAGAMRDMVMTMSSEEDRAVYADPSFDRAFTLALEEGFAHGPAGYVRDTVLAMSPWPFDPADIEVPVDLWYGGLDTSPVHSPDFGETLARRIPQSSRHFFADEGSALLWTRGAQILERLLELVKTGR